MSEYNEDSKELERLYFGLSRLNQSTSFFSIVYRMITVYFQSLQRQDIEDYHDDVGI